MTAPRFIERDNKKCPTVVDHFFVFDQGKHYLRENCELVKKTLRGRVFRAWPDGVFALILTSARQTSERMSFFILERGMEDSE